MTNEIEKMFFDTFGIEPCIRDWWQFNYAQVERGLKIFPERQKLADDGYIKITQKMLNPQPENDCVYWEEYHYPEITDHILLELICIRCKELISIIKVRGNNLEELKNYILQTWAHWYTYYSSLPVHKERADNFKRRVRALFEEKQ